MHPDSELLFSYANGEEIDEDKKEEIKRHLLECESCRKEYNSHVAMRHLLVEYWDGKIEGCFNSNTLAEYIEDLVDDDIKRRIEEHIIYCKVCYSELELMKQIEITPESAQEGTAIPQELDDKILTAILARREAILVGAGHLSLFERVKKNFNDSAKSLTERFIAKYHKSEQSKVNTFWKMLSPLYSKEARFGSITFESGVSAAVGDSKDSHTPSIIFTMMGICDHLQEFDEIPDTKELKRIIRKNAKRFNVSRQEREKLENFLIQEFISD